MEEQSAVTTADEPAEKPSRPDRRFQSLLLIIFLAVITVDSSPNFFRLLTVPKKRLDPVLDLTGLWQSSWQLFAPDVDKVNTRVSAEIFFSDGGSVKWRSPDWDRMRASERFFRFRESEFYDNIRMDDNRAAWESFADHLTRTAVQKYREENPQTTATPSRIAIFRHWDTVPYPHPASLVPYGSFPPITGKYQFYEKSYSK